MTAVKLIQTKNAKVIDTGNNHSSDYNQYSQRENKIGLSLADYAKARRMTELKPLALHIAGGGERLRPTSSRLEEFQATAHRIGTGHDNIGAGESSPAGGTPFRMDSKLERDSEIEGRSEKRRDHVRKTLRSELLKTLIQNALARCESFS
jgi:hypothetical protein